MTAPEATTAEAARGATSPRGLATRLPRRLAALEEREFRLLFLATAASLLGDQLIPIALAFAVLEITGSIQALGLVLGAAWLPSAFFLLVGGVLADRVSRRKLMIAADLARFASQGTAALLVLSGTAQIWHLLVLQLAHGTASAFFDPAMSGLIPQTVSAGRLQEANALRVLARSTAMLAGPALAGLIVATAGPGWALGVDAATFAASALLLACMRLGALMLPPQREAVLTELARGWYEFRSRTWLWVMVAQGAVFHMLVVAPVLTLGVVVSARELGGAPAWSTILVAFGVGAIVGGVAGLRIRPSRPLVVAAIALSGVAPHIVLLAVAAPLPAIAVAATLGGLGMALFGTLWDTTLQQQVPQRVLSRVSAYDWLGSVAGFPLGYALVGTLAAVLGVHGSLWLAAAVVVSSSVFVALLPSVRAIRGSAIAVR